MPVSKPLPPPESCPRLPDSFLDVPRPPAALDNVMEAIEGDGSPYSYLCASLLARELAEFGARWHGTSWGVVRILGGMPRTEASHEVGAQSLSDSYWSWQQPKPVRWSPQVAVTGEHVEVNFHVRRIVGSESITCITDTFRVGQYPCTSREVDLATGAGGIIF